MRKPIGQKTKKRNLKAFDDYFYANIKKRHPENPFDNAYEEKQKKRLRNKP